jgi:polysaccharide deacetylase family protein (PEP-CTERM system associated)
MKADPQNHPSYDHALTFDVEEYFQVEAARRSGVSHADWTSYEHRLDGPMDVILELLADRGVRATFFVLGWVAKHQPDLVRRIASTGHELASHGMDHRMVTELTPQEFRDQLTDSRSLLQDLSGQPIEGYRAPTFSVTPGTCWALDVLAECGYRYDSSVFPVAHDRYGMPGAPAWRHRAVGPDGGELLEVPPLTLRWLGRNWPVGGGGYLRLLPTWLIERGIRTAGREGQSAMIYLHPWELDADQPVLPMNTANRWRHRVGLARTRRKLERLMDRHRFGPASQFLDDGRDCPRVRYGPTGALPEDSGCSA